MTTKARIITYLYSTIGMFLVAVGIALSVVANLGIGALNTPCYALAAGIPGFTIGMGNFLVYTMLILIQFLILKKNFKPEHLLQLVANALLSLMIDGSMWILAFLGVAPEGFIPRLVLVAFSAIITAFGVSLEVASKAWMLPAEMTVSAITSRFGGKFGTNKVIMDCGMLGLGVVLSIILCDGRPLGPVDQPITGWGTLILAVSVGLLMKLTDPLVSKILKQN